MITRSYKALTARPVLVLAALLVGLMLYAASGTVYAQDATIEYAENDTIPVATLQASDEDDDDIVWTLSGTDAGAFDISTSGVLTFMDPPDFEAKATYMVTAEAADGSFELVVNITNVEEPGSVRLSQIQPQVEIDVVATVSDPDDSATITTDDITGTTWQWAKSMDMSSWTDIENETSGTYTPVIADIDYYLRASATYTDTLGAGKTAEMVSERAVEPETPANAFPAFPKEDFNDDGTDETGEPGDTDNGIDAAPFLREVDENTGEGMNIGNPIMATDDDGDDLLYTLTSGDPNAEIDTKKDADRFTIDERTGQIKTKDPLDFEVLDADPNADVDNDNAYEVIVTATDPSEAATMALVEITVKDLNEPPTFDDDSNPKSWTVNEEDREDATEDELTPMVDVDREEDTYAATDVDETDGPDPGTSTDDTVTLTVEGPDKGAVGEGKAFTFTGIPGDPYTLAVGDDTKIDYENKKEYSLTIVATDSNTEAAGRTPMTKSIDVKIKVNNLQEAGTVSYDQVQPQVGVAVTAMLDDPDMGVTGTTWQWGREDLGGDQNCSNVTIADDGSDDIMGATSATYTPKEADVAMCLRAAATYRDNASDKDDTTTVSTDESLNMADDDATTFAVEAKTTGNALPNFTEEDMDEDDVKETGAPGAPFMRSVDENTASGMAIGNPVPGADKDNDELVFTLGGADAASFSITESGDDGAGQLKTKSDLDFEMQSSYMLEVTATDPSLASKMAMVMVTVKDMNEKAEITGDDPEDYPENGTGTVATFMATDEDSQDDADMWGVEGADKDSFDIAGGVLTFKNPPNFETNPSYAVTVTVTDRDVKATKDVTVKIVNMEEPGSVKLSQIQPQVEIEVTAKASDPDNPPDGVVTGTMWQWARSLDMTAWTDIDKETSMAYTPVVADEGYYLRATATYTDTLGDEKTAEMVSERAVEPETPANATPAFAMEDFDDDGMDETGEPAVPFLRNVDENMPAGMNVGNPIAATDDDGDDLLYTLTSGDPTAAIGTKKDADRFTIDERTGQIKTKDPLDFEVVVDDPNADVTNNDTYEVMVTATDPSLAAKTVLVSIRVQDLNEAPDFGDDAPTKLRITENQASIVVDDETEAGGNLDGYTAMDKDTEDTRTYSLGGDDASAFALDEANAVLTFPVTDTAGPDFESKSSYSIIIKATDANSEALDRTPMVTELAVTVKVVNLDEDGSVSFSQVQPQIGVPITAMISDPDGSITGTTWQWGTGTGEANGACDDNGTFEDIEGATSATYTPTEANVCLNATATYSDAIVGTPDDDQTPADESLDMMSGAAAMGVEPKTTGNAAPKFGEEDLDDDGVMEKGTADAPFVRIVDENTAAPGGIGNPVGASDPDGDARIYKLGGADAMYFDIESTNGQIKVGDGTMLDFEMRESYMVEVTAYDPSLASAKAIVMIMVLDKEEDATLSLVTPPNNAPAFDDGSSTTRMVAENAAAGAYVGDPVTATDDDDDSLTYELSGSMYFDVNDDGQIMTTAMLDYEAMMSHMVTVTASDDDDSASIDVTITVTDMYPGCTVAGNNGLTNDCEALLAAEGTLGGSLNWDEDTDIADWDGVTVSGDPMRVTGLKLRDMDLTGSIPDSLGDLDYLTVLDLHTNMLSGDIPDLSGLTMLEELYLANNQLLTGNVPMWLNDMSGMKMVWLWGNMLSGEIPDLSGMTSLLELKLAGNDLTGGIPEASMLPANVEWLILHDNQLDGGIPDLSDLSSLRILWLHTNDLTGVIPDSFGSLTSLTSANLRNNRLSGVIPDLSGLDNLQWLRLHRNMLEGEIPGTVGDLDSLSKLWLHGNKLTGIGAGLADADDTLTHLYLRENSFAAGACLPGDLASVANNDFADASLEACQ